MRSEAGLGKFNSYDELGRCALRRGGCSDAVCIVDPKRFIVTSTLCSSSVDLDRNAWLKDDGSCLSVSTFIRVDAIDQISFMTLSPQAGIVDMFSLVQIIAWYCTIFNAGNT